MPRARGCPSGSGLALTVVRMLATCSHAMEECMVGGVLTSGQGTGLAEAMLPKRTAARTAGIVILSCILAGEDLLYGLGGRRVGRRGDLQFPVGARASNE